LDAHYLLVLKGNQPRVLIVAQAALSGVNTDWVATSAVEDDRDHGRTERRAIRTAVADDVAPATGAARCDRLSRVM
jgi:hypothetical protein